jgi:hypothetical protein
MRVAEWPFATRLQFVDKCLHCDRPYRVGHGVPLIRHGESAATQGFAARRSTWHQSIKPNCKPKYCFQIQSKAFAYAACAGLKQTIALS